MTKDKDFWWAVLVTAETASEDFNGKGDGHEAVLAMNVGNRARRELIKLGLNLDNIFPEATDEFRKLYEEGIQKEESRKQVFRDYERVIKDTEELVKRHNK